LQRQSDHSTLPKRRERKSGRLERSEQGKENIKKETQKKREKGRD
jgi:hypothetical protein